MKVEVEITQEDIDTGRADGLTGEQMIERAIRTALDQRGTSAITTPDTSAG